MEKSKIEKIDNFLKKDEKIKRKVINSQETEVCNMDTGDCYTIKNKDGIVERMNKKFITNDGRQLLQD